MHYSMFYKLLFYKFIDVVDYEAMAQGHRRATEKRDGCAVDTQSGEGNI